MREAVRRPTGDGVLDYTGEFQMPGPRLSGNFGILAPPLLFHPGSLRIPPAGVILLAGPVFNPAKTTSFLS